MPRLNPPRRPKGTPKTGGRLKGTPNHATLEVKAIAAAILSDGAYRAGLILRINKGTAPHMETLLWHYAYGKPKELMSIDANIHGAVTVKFVDA